VPKVAEEGSRLWPPAASPDPIAATGESRPPGSSPDGRARRSATAEDTELRAPAASDAATLAHQVQSTLAREVHRTWILSAMADLVAERGLESVTVRQLVTRASASRRRFYELFENREDCFRVVFEEAVTIATERVSANCTPGQAWADRLRAGLTALLTFFDAEPELASVCMLHATPAVPVTLARRREIFWRLAEVIDEGRLEATDGALDPPPLTAESLVGGALGVVQARLLETSPRPLVTLVNPLMSLIVLPYLGHAAAQRELAHSVTTPASPTESARSPLERLDMRLTYRTLRVLSAIAHTPGISNRGAAEAAGVRDEGQISKLLARVERFGLIRNTGAGQAKGAANAWTLTPRGAELDRALAPELWATFDGGAR
jgi:AcrR family transcriptional regulator/DNA-binding MarR family transcriptional regulator